MTLFQKKEKYEPIRSMIGDGIDYSVYNETIKEKILWFLLGMIASGAVLYIFYESILVSVIAGAICGVVFIPIRRKQVIKKRRQKLTMQFRGLLDSLATSVGAGKNIQNSLEDAIDDLAVQFSTDAYIVQELEIIVAGVYHNIPTEELMMNFAARSQVDDIENFANVFATCYRRGGNINEVIKNTAEILRDKIEIKLELETMVSGQKNEMNIMLVMPVLFIVVMKSMGGGLVDLSTPIGILSVTIALASFVAAYFVGQWITDIKL